MFSVYNTGVYWFRGSSILKFIYSLKAPKFCEISTNYLPYVLAVKWLVEISQNCVAFSEYVYELYRNDTEGSSALEIWPVSFTSMSPKWFWTIQNLLVGFRRCPNHFGQVQITKINSEKPNLNMTKMIWTRPKRFGPDQNNLYPSKTFRTNRRTRRKY